MPKRSYDTSTSLGDVKIPPTKVQKTERSHEENQERAYIAASRRTDRSLEARVQSAKMASDIHRKRTGRGLRVSEEIVLKEEMYEEMEDEMPRQYKLLTAHLAIKSPELSQRMNAFVVSQTAMAALAKYDDIDKRFNEAFPRAASYSHQIHTPYASVMDQCHSSPSITYNPGSMVPSGDKKPSISTQSHCSNAEKTILHPSQNSTPELSPATTSSDVSEFTNPPCPALPPTFSHLPLDPQLTQPSSCSFTSELPNEVKMMTNLNFDTGNLMAMLHYGEGASPSFAPFDACGGVDAPSYCHFPSGGPTPKDCRKTTNEIPISPLSHREISTINTENLLTPSGGNYLSDNFIGDTDAWESNEFESFLNFDNE